MSDTDEAENVEVEVTLIGGRAYSTVLPSTSPILRDLYLALGSRDSRSTATPHSLCNCRSTAGRLRMLVPVDLTGGLADQASGLAPDAGRRPATHHYRGRLQTM